MDDIIRQYYMGTMDFENFCIEQRGEWFSLQKYNLGRLDKGCVIGEHDTDIKQVNIVDVLFGKKQLEKFSCKICEDNQVWDYNYFSDNHTKRICNSCRLQIQLVPTMLKRISQKCMNCQELWLDSRYLYFGVCPKCDIWYKPYLSNPLLIKSVIQTIPSQYHKYIFDDCIKNWKSQYDKVVMDIETKVNGGYVVI